MAANAERNGAITRIAADIGGTFTDIAVLTGDGTLATRKVPSTPANYADAVVAGVTALLAELGSAPAAIEEVLHGCTVATNAILEHKGAKTALLTTKGFRDVLEIQRIRVPRLYDPLYEKPPPLVPRNLRFEVEERLDASGAVLTPLDTDGVYRAIEKIRAADVEAVAVCFLHSYANPDHERQVGEILQRALPDRYISLSVDVLPQKREYERTSTTVINSYIGPLIRDYVESMVAHLADVGVKGRLMVMQSSGGILDARSAVGRPAHIIECGPAAGVVGGEYLARLSGIDNIITFDMGGTTAKASVIEDGAPSFAEEYEVGAGLSSSSPLVGGGGYALKLPVIDISEVGAGGGSIAWLDKGGSLKVGPESAGAVPGPACYGLGSDDPTVTDANVVLGYLNPQALAGGAVPVDAVLARGAIPARIAEPLGRDVIETAHGIHIIANANMMKAVKAVTTYRGRDPRDFALLAFGGSGGCARRARPTNAASRRWSTSRSRSTTITRTSSRSTRRRSAAEPQADTPDECFLARCQSRRETDENRCFRNLLRDPQNLAAGEIRPARCNGADPDTAEQTETQRYGHGPPAKQREHKDSHENGQANCARHVLLAGQESTRGRHND